VVDTRVVVDREVDSREVELPEVGKLGNGPTAADIPEVFGSADAVLAVAPFPVAELVDHLDWVLFHPADLRRREVFGPLGDCQDRVG
jgi:hypothetical protein